MKLITNSVSPTQVRDTDDAFVIKDVPFIKPMELSGGYVPRANIKATTPRWDGVPATLRHPRNAQGQPVPAERKPDTHIGSVKNPHFDGEFVRANIRLPKAELQTADTKQIRDALESGERISVSSQYKADPAPPGEYDGQMRENVERITRPDSVAILPNQPGVCDIEDGCGINPSLVANAEVTLPVQANKQHFKEGDLVEWQTGDATAQGRVLEAFTDPDEQESVTRTFDGNEVTRKVTEDEGAYLVEAWNAETEEFDPDKQALKSGSQVSAWENPPEAAQSAVANTDDGVKASEGMAEGMNANQEPQEFALTDVGPDDVDEYTGSEWDGDAATAAMPKPSEGGEEAAKALDAAHLLHPTEEDMRDDKSNWKLPFREGPNAPVNTRALVAGKTGRGLPALDNVSQADKEGARERIQDFLVDAPDDLFGAIEEETESQGTHDEDMQGNIGERTEELIVNHGFRADHLPPEDSRCFQRIYDQFTANADTSEDDSMSDNKVGLDDLTDDAQEALVDKAEARLEANRKEEQKDSLAEEIVANSNEYGDIESVKEDYPTKTALKTKERELKDTGATPAMGATRDAPSANTGDLDVDVGTGVLTE